MEGLLLVLDKYSIQYCPCGTEISEIHCRVLDLGPPFRRAAIPGYYCYNNPKPNPNPNTNTNLTLILTLTLT